MQNHEHISGKKIINVVLNNINLVTKSTVKLLLDRKANLITKRTISLFLGRNINLVLNRSIKINLNSYLHLCVLV